MAHWDSLAPRSYHSRASGIMTILDWTDRTVRGRIVPVGEPSHAVDETLPPGTFQAVSFDLVLRQRDYFLPGPQALFRSMRSALLRARAAELGGYDVDAIGQVRWVN